MTETIRNWDRTQRWRPEEVHHPADEKEVARLVRRAAEGGKRVKAVGSALSWSDIIDMPQAALRFDRMADVVNVDRDRCLITVQPGAVLRDVNDVLYENGLAFDNFGSIVIQTAAGYTGTGTHGTGGSTPILSSQIQSMRLIDGEGEIHELDTEREPELFSAARVHLGCLGVLTEITFRCIEAFDVEERLELVPWDNALADLDDYVDGNDYCKLWWFPYTDHVQVYSFNATDKPRGGFGLTGWLDESGVSGVVFTALMALTRAVPPIVPSMTRTLQAIHFRPRTRVDRSDRVIKVSSGIPVHQETEYAIPRDRAAQAIDETRKLVLAGGFRVNFPMEVRFVAADDIPMSPANGRDSCYVGAYVASRRWAEAYHAEFEEMIAEFEGRPHWGKTFSRTADELRALYPAYDHFDALRRRCDPAGVFRNSFVDRVFPP
jgi:L-gulonolactone oxidase